MIISYPILTMPPAGNAMEESEDAWLARLLAESDDPKGAYPARMIGNTYCWHGGLHIGANSATPVRAIADGTIVAYRLAPKTETYEGRPYDTSFVLLRHETETGAATPVVFYSLYMNLAAAEHLHGRTDTLPACYRTRTSPDARVPDDPKNAKIYRRDILGYPGSQHQTGRSGFHFEIFCTDEALAGFFRDSGRITENGSADIYGDVHFVIPEGKSFVAAHPRLPKGNGVWRTADKDGNLMFPAGTAGSNTGQQLYVSVRLDKDKRITIARIRTAQGQYRELGRVEQPGYGYAMLALAEALYPDNPSAGLEWLTFGRVLSEERSRHTDNWQLVHYAPSSVGYIDLSQAGIVRLSDADFPHWLGWKKVEEGAMLTPADAIVDEPATLQMLSGNGDAGKAALRHLVVKHPTEWDISDLDARFARLREPGMPLVSEDSWQRFKEQAQKLAFWQHTGLPRAVWHFNPLQFIHHMRRALWLSVGELRQAVPARMLRGIGSGIPDKIVYEAATRDAGVLARSHKDRLNTAWRKYGITTRARLAAFLGNSVQETVWFSTLEEKGGSRYWYSPWFGRGFLQLTHTPNYLEYWKFRGRNIDAAMDAALRATYGRAKQLRSNVPLHGAELTLAGNIVNWREDVAVDAYSAADSAGHYWLKNRANEELDTIKPNYRHAFSVHFSSQLRRQDAFVFYENASFRRASCIVNLPGHLSRKNPQLNGLVDRYHAYAYAQVLLFDYPTFPDRAGIVQFKPEDYEWKR
ncbi:M23 family metallopeptidase [Cupriavidus sp. WGlv3]|uniref:M23 family metallopeptidase n=1 Tax=Cupriavidus sp. WGlv3 TaxID=2919924 RepID=UPI002091AD4E|nr:M23 family metallopeptidase [Cupriavidus sp. WGlv3]MCO4863979.1 M23 family metallopeptidase [Cupriavidus sp. WGlv3]